jgi:2-dehydro-3-deoxy-D-arabinonate dehydratase
MPRALYRLRLPDGSARLARGEVARGPLELLPDGSTLGQLLAGDGAALAAAVLGTAGAAPVPAGAALLAPVDAQEVWAAGVTYLRSRDARMVESAGASVYDHVYAASRPELFFKSAGWRVRGPGEPIGIRADSTWDVPEPELTLVLAASGSIVGYAIGDDVSSRSIEGENPLYLPQAKIYDGSCAIGPAVVPATEVHPPFEIRLNIERDGRVISSGTTSTDRIRRDLGELASHLVRALAMPAGAFLMTGTGIVPEDGFTLRPGDRVRVEIDELGALENVVERVGAEEAS